MAARGRTGGREELVPDEEASRNDAAGGWGCAGDERERHQGYGGCGGGAGCGHGGCDSVGGGEVVGVRGREVVGEKLEA